MNEIIINGEKYIKKSDIGPIEQSDYVIVRTYSAGVFAGNIESRNNDSVVMRDARRIWYWGGAASLSELAMNGTKKPNECKFPTEVERVELFGVVEILNTTKKAQESIKSVPVWSA